MTSLLETLKERLRMHRRNHECDCGTIDECDAHKSELGDMITLLSLANKQFDEGVDKVKSMGTDCWGAGYVLPSKEAKRIKNELYGGDDA